MVRRQIDYDNDQDRIAVFNLPLVIKRRIHELHGMSAAIVYDGVVSDDEIAMLRHWLTTNRDYADQWPVSALWDLLSRILADGVVTPDERLELFEFLSATAAAPGRCGKAAENIFDHVEVVVVSDHSFMFTGRLTFGDRKMAEAAVLRLGGTIAGSPSSSLGYLVVGDLGSDAWKQSRYGTKIQRVMENRARGALTRIIEERAFIRSMSGAL